MIVRTSPFLMDEFKSKKGTVFIKNKSGLNCKAPVLNERDGIVMKEQFKKIIVGIMVVLAFVFVGCAPKQGTDHLAEKAKLEGRAGFEGQVDSQNQRAREVEKDLERKFALYSAFEGSYEGVLQTERGDFLVRMTLVPNLSKMKVNRPRTLEEIVYDLNTLAMNTQILQWRPDSPQSAIGCMINQVRPDFGRLYLSIAAESCPSLYRFNASIENENHEVLTSEDLYQYVDNDRKVSVIELQGEIKPNTNARIYPVKLKKVILDETKK